MAVELGGGTDEIPTPVDTFLALEPVEREPSEYAEFVEPLAVILHGFDPVANELGVAWEQEPETSRGRDVQDAYRRMAESILDGIGPMLRRRFERETSNARSAGVSRLWNPRSGTGRHAAR